MTELNWSVEEAIRTVMSGGILTLDFLTIVPNEALRTGIHHRDGPCAGTNPPNTQGGPTTKA
jgi:hypothetical protein